MRGGAVSRYARTPSPTPTPDDPNVDLVYGAYQRGLYLTALAEAQRHDGPNIKHDISLPVSAIARFLDEARAALTAALPGVRFVTLAVMACRPACCARRPPGSSVSDPRRPPEARLRCEGPEAKSN